jgi:hypothetical protein
VAFERANRGVADKPCRAGLGEVEELEKRYEMGWFDNFTPIPPGGEGVGFIMYF